ncbi:MAG TPA: sporulation integral membrane protein YlbJ [Candidatus Scatovivens faecipullorum]|nr:sporulation integral membrane protein YlbJ [Candidatus Scatovivens faecipullorum]
MSFLVINLKKYFFTIIFFLFMITLLIFSNNNLIAAQNGLALWAKNVLPTLFPFFVATELLCQTNFTYILGKLLNKLIKPIFNLPGESVIAIILGTISGYPIGAKVVCNLKNQKIITKIEAERLIAFTNNSGPLFILGTVGITLFHNKHLGIILLISHIFSSLTVGYLFRFWKRNKLDVNFREIHFNSKLAPIKISEIGEILGNAIKKSISSILSVGGFIVLFSVILSILENSGILDIINMFLYQFGISKEISSAIFTGIIEVTNGVNLSSSIYTSLPTLSILLTSFLLGFGGISVLLQVYSIISKENISVKPYLLGKLLQGFLSILFTFILL